MTASILKGPGPLLALLAVGAVAFVYMRSAKPAPGSAAASLRTRRPIQAPGGIDRTQTYANPQAVGELLARSVIGITNSFFPDRPKVAGPGVAIGSVENRDALRRAEAAGAESYGFGLDDFWSGPVVSTVDPSSSAVYSGDPYHGGDLVDSIPAGPVYDVSTDYTANPWTDAGSYWGVE